MTASGFIVVLDPIERKGVAMQTDTQTITDERADLLETLAKHRGFLLRTVQGMTDEQAGLRPTVSELCLGGIVKHVSRMEERWVDFILEGPDAIGPADATAFEAHLASFLMDGVSLAELVARYGTVARRTDELVATLSSLDDAHPLPVAPWFEADAELVGPAHPAPHHRRNGSARRPR